MTTTKHPRHGSSLDDLLAEDGTLGEFQAVAVKEVIAWQLQEAHFRKRRQRKA
jgi:antitoxin HicB